MTLDFHKSTYQEVSALRDVYLLSTSAALDGMWENAFLPMADHWKLADAKEVIGFCSVNSEGKMLGFHVENEALDRLVYARCIEQLNVSGAFASTAEPRYLSLCADHQSSMSVNALMYAESCEVPAKPVAPPGMSFRIAELEDLKTAVSFGVDAIQADQDWLLGYFEERIQQQELFGLWRETELIATGECRISPNQAGIADVGMIVGPAHRKNGLATAMLKYLRPIGSQKGLKLICSTESSNIGAQKAIERAGFVSQHRILCFEF
ncbi:MAG: GNAT family N-acetyltransferase [Litorimonas sp.]